MFVLIYTVLAPATAKATEWLVFVNFVVQPLILLKKHRTINNESLHTLWIESSTKLLLEILNSEKKFFNLKSECLPCLASDKVPQVQ